MRIVLIVHHVPKGGVEDARKELEKLSEVWFSPTPVKYVYVPILKEEPCVA